MIRRPSTAAPILAILIVLLPRCCWSEPPTRAAIIALNAECRATGQRMDLIARFGTDFSGLDLSGVDLRGAWAVGSETNLSGANFANANLQGANLGNAILDQADFSGADLSDAQFMSASLRGANLAGLDLSACSMDGCDFSGAKLMHCNLTQEGQRSLGQHFSGADLTGADLHGLWLWGSDFSHATLRSANLRDTFLELSDFTNADLENADFAGANVNAADFTSARGLEPDALQLLERRSRRWEYTLQLHVQAFLGSPLFAVFLLVLIPSAALGTGWLRKRSQPLAVAEKKWWQFHISTMLFATFVVAIFVGTAMVSQVGLFSLTMVSAFYLMVGEMAWNQQSRWQAARLLAAAILYAVLNVVSVSAAWGDAPSQVLGLLGLFGLVAPPLTLGTILASYLMRQERLPKLGFFGLVVWMGGISFANLWLGAEIAASC